MIKLYLDENIAEAIASSLRLKGYDAITVKEVNRKGLSDEDQLVYAFSENRVILTHDKSDYSKLHLESIRIN